MTTQQNLTSRKPLLNITAIQTAAAKYFELHGTWPSANTKDEVPGYPGETWSSFNNAGTTGSRGLKTGQTLSEIIKPLREERGEIITRLPLTSAKIIEAAIKYYETYNKWPNVGSPESVPDIPNDTWRTLNAAGQAGSRGLEKRQTLAKILVPIKKEYGSKIHGLSLSPEIVKAAAIKFYETYKKWPNQDSNEEVPGLPGETWASIDSSGLNGRRGLEKGQSLAVFLRPLKEEYGSRVRIVGAALTVEKIIEAAEQHYLLYNKWPVRLSEEEVPGIPGDSWGAIADALRRGFRGLDGGQSLHEIIRPSMEKFGTRIHGLPLELEKIKEAAITHYKTTGKWPNVNTKDPVPGMPHETWSTINQASSNGIRGLEAGLSLKKILEPLKVEHGSRIYGAPLTIEDIRKASIEFYNIYSKWPHCNSKVPVPGMPGETWSAINEASNRGLRGLPKGLTLSGILLPLKIEFGSKILCLAITTEEIRETLIQYYEIYDSWPIASTPDPVPGRPGDTWSAIDTALKKGARGLNGGDSLFEFINRIKADIGFKIRGAPLSLEAIESASFKFFETYGKWPNAHTKEEVPGMNGETWGAINSAGYNGTRELSKGMTLSKIVEPLKERFSNHLGTSMLPLAFREIKGHYQGLHKAHQISERAIGASYERIQSVHFSKGETFEQLAGLSILCLHSNEKVIPQYCLSVDEDSGFYGVRADFKAGYKIFEIKWGAATDNINETQKRHLLHLKPEYDYNLILLHPNSLVNFKYKLFDNFIENSKLQNQLIFLKAYLEDEVSRENLSSLTLLRNYLYGLLIKGNLHIGEKRLSFISQELNSFIQSSDKYEFMQMRQYAAYSPLTAFFEHKGRLYQGRITPSALQSEDSDRYRTIWHFGRLKFDNALHRDIAVMCELSETGINSEKLLGQSKGYVKDPVFSFLDGRIVSADEIADLDDLKSILKFPNDNFEFGLQYISYCGSYA